VKYYSSGMFVRLGFAVAVNVDPDLLLIDEVLAVGDEAFQQKCLEKIEDFQREGRTLLFVTHAAELVRRICNRGIVLDHGHMVADAEPGEAIRVFRSYLHGADTTADDAGHLESTEFPIQLTAMTISSTDGEVRHVIHPGEPLRLEIDYHCDEPVSEALLQIEIRNGRGETLYSATSDALGAPLPELSGDGRLFMEFASIPLLDGRYPITVQIRHHHDGRVLGMRENLDAFEVTHLGKVEGTVLLPAKLTFGNRASA
jgi:ABC-2 type transport system ATP-binding protein